MDEREHDFLGPQLMKDWVAEADSRAMRHKAPAVRMSIGTGRDELIVNRKGQVLVKKFNEPTYLGTILSFSFLQSLTPKPLLSLPLNEFTSILFSYHTIASLY